jgi:hypothetical protein
MGAPSAEFSPGWQTAHDIDRFPQSPDRGDASSQTGPHASEDDQPAQG